MSCTILKISDLDLDLQGQIGLQTSKNFIIVAYLENASIGYSLESLCVCVCVCVFVCVCFCTITQKEIDLGT